MQDRLSGQEKETLLQLARQAMQAAVRQETLPTIERLELTQRLREPGASFVTLTMSGRLRGCIGALEPYQPLVEDVREHAVAAALEDYRFPPVSEKELPQIRIEISRLTLPQVLSYSSADDLLARLHPGVDGVILRDGPRRATYLPQVWEKVPDPQEFLASLCQKMGAGPDTWRRRHLEVLVYQVEDFHEAPAAG